MAVIKFVPKKGIEPIFAVKLNPAFTKLIANLEDEDAEKHMKAALNINPKRMINIKEVEDAQGNLGYILILYDYIYKEKRPKSVVPQTEDGYFDFRIYQLDFNKDINIENIIEDQKVLFKR
jgi:acetylornithine deacetylase/succinyl-diaminopimelate desuccinylase-like protein